MTDTGGDIDSLAQLVNRDEAGRLSGTGRAPVVRALSGRGGMPAGRIL
jgi:hypothetical protein